MGDEACSSTARTFELLGEHEGIVVRWRDPRGAVLWRDVPKRQALGPLRAQAKGTVLDGLAEDTMLAFSSSSSYPEQQETMLCRMGFGLDQLRAFDSL